VATDPAPFLSTIALASAGLVAIVGGLLVARFVSLDSEQRGSRKVITDATERLESARRRAREAHAGVLNWHARHFFQGRVLVAVSEGTSDRPRSCGSATGRTRMTISGLSPKNWPQSSPGHGPIDDFTGLDGWDQFRAATPELPDIRWDRAWEHVFEQISLERAEERKAARRHARDRFGVGALTEQLADPAYLRNLTALAPGRTDYGVIAARREDELEAADARAQQRVEDYEAELGRLRQAHLEIVRPDGWLWMGVAVLAAFAIVGVAWPMWVMSRGPDDLDRVSWLLYPFLAGLAVLIAYIVLYLVHLTRAGRDRAASGGATAGEGP
jgi:hypothetical protein